MKLRVLSKTALFHALLKKNKRPKRCRFERHCNLSFSPGRAKQGRKKIFSSYVFHRQLSLKKTPTNPTCPKLSTCWRRGRRCVPRAVFRAAAQWPPPASLSPVFPINTGESTREKGLKK